MSIRLVAVRLTPGLTRVGRSSQGTPEGEKSMNAAWKFGTALALIIALGGGRSGADDLKKIEEAGKPGPEHAKLQPLAGTWDYTAKCTMDPAQPPIETKGTIERKWIFGGRFLEEKIEGTGLDGTPKGFQGLGLLGYDNVLKTYTYTFACNMGTGISSGTGTADPSAREFTFKSTCSCPIQQKTVTGRDVIRIESNDKIVMESYLVDGGKEQKMMEIVATRKK
jgi:hypothetical protein